MTAILLRPRVIANNVIRSRFSLAYIAILINFRSVVTRFCGNASNTSVVAQY
ncbi:unnamed protein product [Haemonchus placei]|uniref:Uncharacterized protein n=1 Tax=Haemonchus placei TaxID=6290 RepID=A0A3P7TXH6_HAEPC|nr:unnamed protein product [Haemonchus placei]